MTKRRNGRWNNWGFDRDRVPFANCLWGECREGFYELEKMVEHVHEGEFDLLSLSLSDEVEYEDERTNERTS